jgi:putative selenium metabolism protein SsnA
MLITHANVVTWGKPNQILEDYAIYIENGCIVDLGLNNELVERYPTSDVLDAGGKFILPGNICAHTHFYGAFSRGMAIPPPAPGNFLQILERLWWPLDKALTLESIQASALVCLVDAIKHGTTTLIDHHASPNAIDGALDVIADAVEQAGVRSVLCYEVTDRGGTEKARAGIRENVRFIQKTNQTRNPLLAATFGLHASLTLSDATLEACRRAAPEGTGFHIHAAESDVDQYDSLAKSGLRVVDRLHKHNLLGSKSILAHAVHVDAREIQTLADTKTWVTHQPRSNMNNAVGMAPVESMLRAGVRLGLGNDGFSNAMWEEWKSAYLVHKAWHRDPRRMSGYDVVEMAIYNNAELATTFFPDMPIGKIEPGAAADLILVDYHPVTPVRAENLPWHILFGFHESMVHTSIVNGKILMKDREFVTLDEEEITAQARELAPQVWERYQENLSESRP